MANKPTRPTSQQTTLKADAPASPSGAKPTLLWLWVGIAAVIVLAGGFAILSSGDDEELTVGSTVPAATDDGSSATTATSSGGAGGEVAEVWPVTLGGTPLVEKPDGEDPAVGTPAPTLSGFAFDGTPVTVDPSKGPVMLVFLAHWCPHCNREIPELLAWRDAGGVPEGLQVIAVTTAVAPDRDNYPPSEWIPKMDWTWPVIADSQDNEAAIGFGVSGFPFSVIIGTDGTVLGRSSGELGQDGIQAFVDDALG